MIAHAIPATMSAKTANVIKKVSKSSAGKGDSPRNNFSKNFETNYEKINWKNRRAKKKLKKKKD